MALGLHFHRTGLTKNTNSSNSHSTTFMDKIHSWWSPESIEKLKKLFDKIIYLFAFVAPLSIIDQVWKVWTQTSEGVSLLMWVMWIPGALFWLIYGLIHKLKPLILTQALWLIVEIAIVIGILVKH